MDCPEDESVQRKIFVGGLTHKTTKNTLREHFSRFGELEDAVVLRWADGRSRGFGYVSFVKGADMGNALMEAHQIGGRQVDVKRAVPGTNKLFVGGLPQNATAAELRNYFEKFGVVSDAVVMMDPATRRSRGFGFVCFLPGNEGAAAVVAALELYKNHSIRGKWIEVKNATPPHRLSSGKDGVAPLAGDGLPSDSSCSRGPSKPKKRGARQQISGIASAPQAEKLQPNKIRLEAELQVGPDPVQGLMPPPSPWPVGLPLVWPPMSEAVTAPPLYWDDRVSGVNLLSSAMSPATPVGTGSSPEGLSPQTPEKGSPLKVLLEDRMPLDDCVPHRTFDASDDLRKSLEYFLRLQMTESVVQSDGNRTPSTRTMTVGSTGSAILEE